MRLLYTALLCLIFIGAHAQEDFNFEVLSNVQYSEAGNDIWGYVDEDGTEYAIVGTVDNTRIYSLADPTAPVEVATISGTNTTWRDMKSFEDHVYVSSEANADGLLVIDMSAAPDTITHHYYRPDIPESAGTSPLGACHNIFIDSLGFVYLSGCSIDDGNKAIIFDLNTSKWEPELVSVLGGSRQEYAHDIMTRDNIMYSSEIYKGSLVMYDVTDKVNPVYLGEATTSFEFTHNAWISDDAKYVFTTDELGNAFVDAYDISDPGNIQRVGMFQPLETAGRGVVPHNTHYKDGYLVTSWYTEGVVITDATRPENMVKVGAYDTWPDADGGTNGCWGAYPWLPSGIVLANDRRYGLFVLQPTYQRACYLEGNVTDAGDGSTINGVDVSIIAPQLNQASTNSLGDYKTGIADAGVYTASFIHPDYVAQDIEVTLTNGEITIQDVQLQKLQQVSVSGLVIEESTGAPIPNGKVVLFSDRREVEIEAGADGTFAIDLFQEEFQAVGGAWGYKQELLTSYTPAVGEQLIFELTPAYEDDFVLDLGWTVSGDASTGQWERATPFGTFGGGGLVNVDSDYDGDIGVKAYVTENLESGGVGDGDVDNGSTILLSPAMQLSNYQDPVLEFRAYFNNSGGSGTPNDDLTVTISDGTNDIPVQVFSLSTDTWTGKMHIPLSSLVDLTQDITVSFTATDRDPGHLVEAGIDVFRVLESVDIVDVQDVDEVSAIMIYPNPAQDFVNLEVQGIELSRIEMFNLAGQLLLSEKGSVNKLNVSDLETGVYNLLLTDIDGQQFNKRIIVK